MKLNRICIKFHHKIKNLKNINFVLLRFLNVLLIKNLGIHFRALKQIYFLSNCSNWCLLQFQIQLELLFVIIFMNKNFWRNKWCWKCFFINNWKTQKHLCCKSITDCSQFKDIADTLYHHKIMHRKCTVPLFYFYIIFLVFMVEALL